jgi:hypothetical protein
MSKPKAASAAATDLPKLAAPAQRALAGAGISQLKQLTNLTEAELLQLHGMGKDAVERLREALKANGLAFRAEPKKNTGAPNKTIRAHLDNIYSLDRYVQGDAYRILMKITDAPVDWAYEAWDELLAGLTHKDNHVRSISAQLLANLAKSDPKGRMLKDFDALLAVTKDKGFVTARHCLQNLWKVGLGGRNQQNRVMEGLARRFEECATEKNGTLIRYDIIQCLKNLYEATTREQVQSTALALIDTETDMKYRKKYASAWRK